MNETRQNKPNSRKKLLIKAAFLLGILVIAVFIMSSCAAPAIDTSEPENGWSETTVNFDQEKGFFDHLLSWIGTFLNWITVIMPARSYILALFIFAIIVEIVLIPFSIKQQKNSIKQAMLKPKEMAIRNRYKGRDDRATQQKVSAEIQELYQKENFNMFGGCLPLLIQLPIVIILYYVVIDPLKYVLGMSGDFTNVVYAYMTAAPESGGLGLTINATRGTIEVLSRMNVVGLDAFEGIKEFCANGPEVYGQIQNVLSNTPNFNIGPVNMGYVPQFGFTFDEKWMYWLLLVPVVTFVVYFFSMKINRKLTFQPAQTADDKAAACSNNMMDITMPIMSVFVTFTVPAAVGIYWIFKSIVGVGRQFIMSKAMPLPVFTEEDYKAAEKEMYGKLPKKIQKSENAGKVRSLHHIDDDDYDENGNYCPKPPEEEQASVPETNDSAEKLPDSKMTQGATLKDESDKKDADDKTKKSKKEKKSLFRKKDGSDKPE